MSIAQAQPAALDGARLQDHRGQVLDGASLRGQPVLLQLLFTTCSSTCPTQVAELVLAHRALPDDVRRRLRVLSLTVDPLTDTPRTLAAYARRLDADRTGWQFLGGDPAQVHRVLDRLQALDSRGGPPRTEDHRTALLLFDGSGRLRLRLGGVPVDRPRLVAELTQLVRQN
jgi:protein SCO1/2